MNDKQFDNSKFKRLRNMLGYTQAIFAEKVESSQQIIAMIENNKRAVPSSIREAFYRNFKISYDEAIDCETAEELNTALNTKIITEATMNNNQVAAIRFYPDAQAAAGAGIYLPESSSEEMLYFDRRWLENTLGVKPENAIMIRARGNSMDSGLNRIDDIRDGDLLLVDISVKDVINNRIFVLQQGNDLRVKRLKKEFNGTVYLLSNNEKEYPPELATQEGSIIGRVVWNGSKGNV